MPLLTGVFLVGALAQADVLEMKNGKVLNGKFAGGTSGSVRFQTDQGVQVIPVGEILAVTFTGKADPATSAPIASPPAQPAAAPAAPPVSVPAVATASTVTVPAGTGMLVRMSEGISSRDRAGKRFSAKLEGDMVANGIVVAKAGTKVYGRLEQSSQARRAVGRSGIEMRLTDIMLNGTLQPILTGNYQERGKSSTGRTVRRTGLGAAIGAVAGGSDGAKTGAAIGAGTSVIQRGDTIEVPSGTLLEFRLVQPFQTQTQ